GYGLPIIPHSLGWMAIAMSSRLLLTHMIGLGATGLYSAGHQVGFVVGMLQDGFNKAWVPWLFARLKTADEPEKARIVRLTYLYQSGLIGFALLLAGAAPPILSLIIPRSFDGAWSFVLWIALAYAFDGAYCSVSNYVFYAERTRSMAAVTFALAIINVPL